MDFHGWEMPVQFAGILGEHQAVRTACGVFDVSHMGQVLISGREAHRFVERVNCNRMSGEPGKGTYAHILAEDGGILDDAITFCLGPERFLAIVNAATQEKDFAWFQRQAAGLDVALENTSNRYGMLAVQGPKAPGLVAEFFPQVLGLPRFGIAEVSWGGETAFVMRTGYTGEDGFEVAASPCKLWADEATKSVFRFDDEVFIWNGRQIYLTVGEKLAMFRILAKGEYPPPGLLVPVRATIRRLRARFGKEFPGLPRR